MPGPARLQLAREVQAGLCGVEFFAFGSELAMSILMELTKRLFSSHFRFPFFSLKYGRPTKLLADELMCLLSWVVLG